MKQRLSKIMDKLEKAYLGAIVAISSFILMNVGNVVNAATVAPPPKLVTGTQKLFNDATVWLLILIPVGAALFIGWQAFQKSLSEDDAVIADKNKKIKTSLIAAVIAESATAIVTLVLSYYA
jgi:hypothetical protein